MPRTLRKRDPTKAKPTQNGTFPPVSPSPRNAQKRPKIVLVSSDSSENGVTAAPLMPRIVGFKMSQTKHSGLLAKDQEQRYFLY